MRRKKSGTILLCLILIAGIGLLIYPSLSSFLNSLHQSHNLVSYADSADRLNDDAVTELWEKARAFNGRLRHTAVLSPLTDAEQREYENILAADRSGIMGQISIPAISVTLPVYHGTSDAVLQSAAGHLEGSTVPTGDASSHCVITGHSGLPSARLFTDLEKLHIGDAFTLRVLDRSFTYRIEDIAVVLPEDTSGLSIIEGRDLCTLVTCTPYGINSHRLLVRGSRVHAEEVQGWAPGDVVDADGMMLAGLVAIGALLILIAVLLIRKGSEPDGNRG